MKILNHLLQVICSLLILACTSENDKVETAENTHSGIEQEDKEIPEALSKDEVMKMTIPDQKTYLSEHYELDYETVLKLSDDQFAELLELHLEGTFDNKSLKQAWKEFANLDDTDSKEYLKDNFSGYENMDIILSFYGPMFHNK